MQYIVKIVMEGHTLEIAQTVGLSKGRPACFIISQTDGGAYTL